MVAPHVIGTLVPHAGMLIVVGYYFLRIAVQHSASCDPCGVARVVSAACGRSL